MSIITQKLRVQESRSVEYEDFLSIAGSGHTLSFLVLDFQVCIYLALVVRL